MDVRDKRLIEMQLDVTAPGVEILAVYSPLGSPSSGNQRHVKYSVPYTMFISAKKMIPNRNKVAI